MEIVNRGASAVDADAPLKETCRRRHGPPALDQVSGGVSMAIGAVFAY
jgi:hypothetical protein